LINSDSITFLSRMTAERVTLRLGVVIAFALVVGCGSKSDRPDLGSVTGTVTLDGVPLTNGAVVFKPEGLRSSRGFTDAEGNYELIYLRDIRGAALGEHRVYLGVVPGEGSAVTSLPKKYSVMSKLTATVEPGSNVFDWTLESDAR